MNSNKLITVMVRGAGEMASATAVSLHRAGFGVVLTELPNPLAIRRTVCFCESIVEGSAQVGGIKSQKCDIDNYINIQNAGDIPILIDSIENIKRIKPNFYIDARMLKRAVRDRRELAEFTIGLGPGFIVGQNCDAIIETVRGHNLGRVLWSGSASKNTRIPGEIGGKSSKRVAYSPGAGNIEWIVNFGDIVDKNQLLGKLGELEIKSQINGMIRGLISPKVIVAEGMKIADVDPRGADIDFKTISDKARCVGRGVLEAILIYLNNSHGNTNLKKNC